MNDQKPRELGVWSARVLGWLVVRVPVDRALPLVAEAHHELGQRIAKAMRRGRL